MINQTLLLTYILSILLFLSTPGPVTVLIISASAKDGFWAGLKTCIGSNTASLLLISLSFIIIQGIFSISETALNWLTLLGACYLLYFSITILKEKANIQKTIDENAQKVSKNHFKDGFLIGISNPKDILFFIAFFPTFLEIYPNHLALTMLILVAIWVALDYTILTLYSFIFAKIKNSQTVNIISKSSGTILLLIALYAIYKMTLVLL